MRKNAHNQPSKHRSDAHSRQQMYLKRYEAQNSTEVPISANFTAQDLGYIFRLKETEVNFKIDKLALNGAQIVTNHQDSHFLYNPIDSRKEYFYIESKLKPSSKHKGLKQFIRMRFRTFETLIKRVGLKKLEMRFNEMSMYTDDSPSFKNNQKIEHEVIFPKKGYSSNAPAPSIHHRYVMTFRFNEGDITKFRTFFKAYRPNVPIGARMSQKDISKYEPARYLKDPNEPATRKKIENYEKKIEKAKKTRIIKVLKEIPYPRFWSSHGGSKTSLKKGETGLLKKVKQSPEYADHPFKVKLLCPIYSCFKVFDSAEKANEHLKEKHSKVFETGFRIQVNGKLALEGDLDRITKDAFIFSKFQNDFMDKVIFEKGKKKLVELKKELNEGKSRFTNAY